MSAKRFVKRLLGQRPGSETLVGVDALDRDWTFRPSRPDVISWIARRRLRRNLVTAPPSATLAAPRPRKRWVLYFVYAPDGELTPAHRYSLRRLRTPDIGLAVVCATPRLDQVPPELVGCTDALYWKGLAGFDFSAYAIGLRALAEHSSHADILVMNDSVYGPFRPVQELFSGPRWDLTGFTASRNIENHIQSYAFLVRDWTPDKLAALHRVMPRGQAYDTYQDVVFCQETVFARAAARVMSVGAWWYADHRRCSDPTIFAALPLLNAGFPFLKKSLLTKHARFQDRDRVVAALRAAGHPVDG